MKVLITGSHRFCRPPPCRTPSTRRPRRRDLGSCVGRRHGPGADRGPPPCRRPHPSLVAGKKPRTCPARCRAPPRRGDVGCELVAAARPLVPGQRHRHSQSARGPAVSSISTRRWWWRHRPRSMAPCAEGAATDRRELSTVSDLPVRHQQGGTGPHRRSIPPRLRAADDPAAAVPRTPAPVVRPSLPPRPSPARSPGSSAVSSDP